MSQLPIVHMTLYKHGVGYFRRRGVLSGEAVKLTFRREEMDDLLKSLTVIDYGAGQVRGVDYDTPQSQAERLAGSSVILDDERSMRDLLVALRGRSVQLMIADGSNETGTLVGLDEDEEAPLKDSLVSILRQDSEAVITIPISRVEGVELQDETAAGDLRFFLQTALGQETHRSITIRLSEGEHDLEVSYIAPAPTWRVSYRFVTDDPTIDDPKALLQGWGIFDNRLEEDLTDISLSLTAGMPISFVYDLYTPYTPSRPVVEEEDRTAAAPVMFGAVVEEEESFAMMDAMEMEPMTRAAPAPKMARGGHTRSASTGEMSESVQSTATGEAMGELFQYNVSVPVTVGRGQSAMVPIVSSTLGFKKDLIYNGSKMPTHPVATIRFENSTSLTLERGPVTVLERGEYVGEAVLPFTASQAEAVISYAVELGIHIKENLKTSSELHALRVNNGYLLRDTYEIRQTTYAVDNRTPDEKSVLIEHPIYGSYTVFDTPEPAEKTLETYRYQVQVSAGKMSEFVVQERYLRTRQESLRNLSYKNLQNYLANKFLDQRTHNELKSLLDAWAEVGRLEGVIKGQESRRAKIYQSQEQAQKNMQVLSNSGEEGRLRGRYVKQLTESEEELTRIDQKINQTQVEIEQKQATIEKMIAALGK